MVEKRIFYTLDGIRGILAIFVMARHLIPFFDPIRIQETYLAVDIFFLLSGIVLCQAYEDKLESKEIRGTRFFLLRLIRIWPLYFLGSLISFAATLITPDQSPVVSHNITYLLLAIFFLPNPFFGISVYPLNSAAWSLAHELFVNAIYGFFARHLRNALLLVIIALSAIGLILIVNLYSYHSLDIGFFARTFPTSLPRVGYSFFMGVAMYRVFAGQNRPMLQGWRANLIALLIIVVMSAILLLSRPIGIWQGVFDVVCVIYIFPALIYASLFCNVTQGFAAVARFLGVTSFAVYAIHTPIGNLLRAINDRWSLGLIEASAPWGGVVLSVLIVGLAYVLDVCYDVPVRRIAYKALNFRRNSSVEAMGAARTGS